MHWVPFAALPLPFDSLPHAPHAWRPAPACAACFTAFSPPHLTCLSCMHALHAPGAATRSEPEIQLPHPPEVVNPEEGGRATEYEPFRGVPPEFAPPEAPGRTEDPAEKPMVSAYGERHA